MDKASEARLMKNVFYFTDSTVTLEHKMAKYWRANVESKGKTVQCSFQYTTGKSSAAAGLMPYNG